MVLEVELSAHSLGTRKAHQLGAAASQNKSKQWLQDDAISTLDVASAHPWMK